MITAKEARELSGATPLELANDELKAVEEKIKQAASMKQRKIYLTSEFWSYGGYKDREEWRAAKRILEEAGYKVRFYYEERQFVDMGTVVEW